MFNGSVWWQRLKGLCTFPPHFCFPLKCLLFPTVWQRIILRAQLISFLCFTSTLPYSVLTVHANKREGLHRLWSIQFWSTVSEEGWGRVGGWQGGKKNKQDKQWRANDEGGRRRNINSVMMLLVREISRLWQRGIQLKRSRENKKRQKILKYCINKWDVS